MSFSSQRNVYNFIDKFHYWLLIKYMKTIIMLKCQQFEDGESGKTKSKRSKCQHLNKYDNKNVNGLDKNKEVIGLDKNKGGIEDARYVSLPFICLPFFP